MGFDSMPVGSIVSKPYKTHLEPDCNFTWDDQVGIKISAVPGIKVVSGVTVRDFNIGVGDGVVYTSPEAEARGLGYVFSTYSVSRWTQCHNNISSWLEPEYVWSSAVVSPLVTSGEIAWSATADACYGPNVWVPRNHIKMVTEMFFVKIADSNQHQVLPQSFNIPIMNVFVYRFNGALVASFSPRLLINSFASSVVVRSCATPTASESLIHLGQFNQQTIQGTPVGGTIANSGRDFSVTFSCPEDLYKVISFFVEPVYGKADGTYGDAGVMKIAQGVGMAAGVGVRLKYGGENVVYRTNPSYNAEFGSDYGKYQIFNSFWGAPYPSMPPDDPDFPLKQRVIQFNASLVRLNEPVVAGQIKAAARIHIIYN